MPDWLVTALIVAAFAAIPTWVVVGVWRAEKRPGGDGIHPSVRHLQLPKPPEGFFWRLKYDRSDGDLQLSLQRPFHASFHSGWVRAYDRRSETAITHQDVQGWAEELLAEHAKAAPGWSAHRAWSEVAKGAPLPDRLREGFTPYDPEASSDVSDQTKAEPPCSSA